MRPKTRSEMESETSLIEKPEQLLYDFSGVLRRNIRQNHRIKTTPTLATATGPRMTLRADAPIWDSKPVVFGMTHNDRVEMRAYRP